MGTTHTQNHQSWSPELNPGPAGPVVSSAGVAASVSPQAEDRPWERYLPSLSETWAWVPGWTPFPPASQVHG